MKIAHYDTSLSAPLIIAEMSGNHNQSLERALQIVDAAAQSGAHAIKLQTYTADTITLNSREKDFVIEDAGSLWNGRNLYDLYCEAHTPWEWHAPIMKRAAELGIICFSSPFDETAVDFLESLNVPAYKIASFENIHIPLIRKVAATQKPIIMSTGMASLADLETAVRTAREYGCTDLTLLKCTSTYPASPENSNLRTIPHLKSLFGCTVGLSDHTMGTGVSVAAVALGAEVIEKHFTLCRADGGVDSAFSLEPDELQMLVKETERAWLSLGTIQYGPTASETRSLIFRRSLYIARDLQAGDTLSAENLRCVRPGFGLKPELFDQVIGKRVLQNISCGTPLKWEHLLAE